MILLKSKDEIEHMRRANVMVAEILAEVRARVRPGVTTAELDALAEEHLRRFGVQKDMAAMLKVPTRALDADELWHSLRMLGNWLSYSDEASHRDPDLGAVSEVIARMWLGMRLALSLVTDGSGDENRCEASS